MVMTDKELLPDYVDRRQWKFNPITGEPLIDGWPLYSGLPPRQWQGLTAEEIAILWKATPQLVGVYSYTDIAREVEAKLKEKNNG